MRSRPGRGREEPIMATVAAEQVVSPFLDRDLSWLQFNGRVLHEALDPRTPLLERVKFLAIFSNNLDEFFMKRVGRLRHRPPAETLLSTIFISHPPGGGAGTLDRHGRW